MLAARWRRWAAVVVALLWILLQNANYEHVLALDAPLSLTYAGYLVDPTFLLGSGLALSRPLLLLLLLVGVGIANCCSSLLGLVWRCGCGLWSPRL